MMSVRIKISLFAGLAVVLFASQLFWDVKDYFKPELLEAWLQESGYFAPIIYMLLMAAAVIISPIPSLPLDITAGAFFGPFLGTVYSVAGALAGALVSFLIARSLGREDT
jgi:uncharacterized membrane protein YdjX (TVP38/TMEM64 family)